MIKVVFAVLFVLITTERVYAYKVFSRSALNSCSIAKLKQREFTVCLKGDASRPDYERAQEWTKLSILAWLRVFKAYDHTLNYSIISNCSNPMLTITLLNGSGRSYAQAGKTWIYNEVPYGTWTHELGHALVGLGDTYTGGRAGACQSGQPESLMCWGGYGPRRDRNEFSTLWDDDIEGARHNYQTLFGASLPSAALDSAFSLLKAFDINRPFPFVDQPVFSLSDSEVNIDEDGELTPINPFAEFE